MRDFVRQARELEGGFSFDPATGMPTGITAKITLEEPSRSLRDAGFVSLDELLNDANTALRQLDFSIWLLLDRLDVAFAQHEQLEKNALRALVELGFFERRGTRGEPDYWVPFLYRDAFHLVQGEARLPT